MKLTKKKYGILIFIAVLVITLVLVILSNRLQTNYDDLSEIDKQILTEYDTLYKSSLEKEIWKDYSLSDKTILTINQHFGNAYLINPKTPINSMLAAEIKMPKDSDIKVYRISILSPQIFKARFDLGNFNTTGVTYSAFGSDYFFTRYDEKSIDAQYSSEHFITFLSHESFHYYVQSNWFSGSRFGGDLSTEDLNLLEEEYKTLSNIQAELSKEVVSKDLLLGYSKEYLLAKEKRLKLNPEYVNQEISMETAEGTATYVGIEASELVDYDFGVMYFDNAKDVPFDDVTEKLKSGLLDKEFVANRMPYESGALLCQLLDALNVDEWQQQLNSQTMDKPVTLFSILQDNVY